MNDIRIALRQLARTPVVSTVAAATLALGIGASTAIFSMVNALLLDALPYEDADRVVMLFEELPDGRLNSVSGGAYKDWLTQDGAFSSIAVVDQVRRNFAGDGEPEDIAGFAVTQNFLETVGIPLQFGRGFAVGDDRPGGNARTVVLSNALWRNRFGGATDIVGRTTTIDGEPYTIVGVTRPGPLLLDQAMFLVPTVIDGKPDEWGRAGHWRMALGRLAPGVSRESAESVLRAIKSRIAADYPEWKRDWSVRAVPLREMFARDARPTLLTLFATAAFVLLIGCANVANLLLARGQARAREMAVRAALGASGGRIVRQVLTESLLLALGGCALGLVIAFVGLEALTALVGSLLPQVVKPSLDATVLAFAVVVALACGVGFGVLPALRARRPDLVSDLRDGDRGGASAGKRRALSWLVVSEFAFTLVLLVGAGLFLKSFVAMVDAETGFDPNGTLAFDVSFAAPKYPTVTSRRQLLERIVERIEAIPGVEAAGSTTALPLSGAGWTELAARDGEIESSEFTVGTDFIGGDYFRAVGVPIVQGRALDARDMQPGAPRTLVIDRGVARALFDDRNPVGQYMSVLGERWEIVGVAAAVRHQQMGAPPQPRVYGALATKGDDQLLVVRGNSLVVRSSLPPAVLADEIRRVVTAIDPAQPITNVRTLGDAITKSLATPRATVLLLGLFAAVALVMAAIGIYGVVSHAVGQRRREIGIRAALGATRGDVLRLVLHGGLLPSLVGIGVGIVAAVAGTRLVASMLFEVQAHDPLVYVAAALLLASIATIAVLVPARRAAKADPSVVLRDG